MIVNIAAAAGIIIIPLAVLFWLRFDINKRAAAIQEAKRELVFRFKMAELAAALKKDAETAKKEKLLIETILPTSDKLINFSKEVNESAKKNKIDANFTFGQETAATDREPGYISFIISADGALPDWLGFIQSLEKMPYFISFDSFNLVANGNQFRSIINGKVFAR